MVDAKVVLLFDYFVGTGGSYLENHTPNYGGPWVKGDAETLHMTMTGGTQRLTRELTPSVPPGPPKTLNSYVTVAPETLDQWIEYHVYGTGSHIFGAFLSYQVAPYASYLVAFYEHTTNLIKIQEYNANEGGAGLAIQTAATFTASDIFRFEVKGRVATVYQNGINVLSGSLTKTQNAGSRVAISWLDDKVNSMTVDNLSYGFIVQPGSAITDSFTDTDGVLLTAHTPDTGGPWRKSAYASANADISGNKLSMPSGAQYFTFPYAANSLQEMYFNFESIPPSSYFEVDLRYDDYGVSALIFGFSFDVDAKLSYVDITDWGFDGLTYVLPVPRTIAASDTIKVSNPYGGTAAIYINDVVLAQTAFNVQCDGAALELYCGTGPFLIDNLNIPSGPPPNYVTADIAESANAQDILRPVRIFHAEQPENITRKVRDANKMVRYHYDLFHPKGSN